MLERTLNGVRERNAVTRTPARLRDGHRREVNPRARGERVSFRERSERALADVGVYRSVSFRDLAEAHFGGHPYTTRRAVNRWIRTGMMREHKARGPKGGTFKVLTLTRKGAKQARRAAVMRGLNPNQRTWSGLVKRSELSHDTEVLRGLWVGAAVAGQPRSHHRARPDRLGAQERRRSP